MNLTSEITSGLWQFMCQAYGLKVRKKSTSLLCKIIRPFTGIPEDKWKNFSTTIGHSIYTDIVPGIEDERTSLLGQCCLIPHECQHRVQNDKDWLFPLKYPLFEDCRARSEVDAYTCNMEIYRELCDAMIPVSAIVDKLRYYRLSESNLRDAERILKIRSEMIWRDGAITEAGKKALSYLIQFQVQRRCSIRLKPVEDFLKVLP